MPITTIVVSSNATHVEVYLIQHYVIKFVSDLQQVCGFLRFSPPIILTHDITEIFLKVALNSKPIFLFSLQKIRISQFLIQIKFLHVIGVRNHGVEEPVISLVLLCLSVLAHLFTLLVLLVNLLCLWL